MTMDTIGGSRTATWDEILQGPSAQPAPAPYPPAQPVPASYLPPQPSAQLPSAQPSAQLPPAQPSAQLPPTQMPPAVQWAPPPAPQESHIAPAPQSPQAPQAPQAPQKDEPSLWAYLRVSLSVTFLVALLALAAAVIVVPAATGSRPLTVLTSSMEPTLPPGTLLVVSPVEPEDIRIGDVVTYQIRSGDPTVVTHRVIAVSKSAGGEYAFTFKGDNNAQPDPDQIREVQIEGRLWYSVPYIGWVNTWVNGEARSYVVPVLAGGLFAFALWMVVSGLRDNVRRRRRVAATGKASGRRRAGTPV
ncbi:MAG: signal peptidase I [Microbacteriaceae bacterium]|nr:signal peptidase I [Microbacteriaceae bacterium]